jgi:hypothetical protein
MKRPDHSGERDFRCQNQKVSLDQKDDLSNRECEWSKTDYPGKALSEDQAVSRGLIAELIFGKIRRNSHSMMEVERGGWRGAYQEVNSSRFGDQVLKPFTDPS